MEVSLLKRVTVVGCGTLGVQIAMLAAYAGHEVRAYDVRPEAFEQGLKRLRSDLEGRGIQPFIPWDQWEKCKSSVRICSTLDDALEGAQLVIEAVPEDISLKQQVFRQIGQLAPPESIVATNSSSIPVSRLEESSGRPERCLNLHFYMPLLGINMVDVMGGSRTLPEVFASGVRWVRALGCVPLTVKKELLGFCFNRVWRAIKKETLYMWANGFVDFRDVDRAWMIFTGMKMGPFGMMDTVGLDVVYDIEMVYYKDSGDPKDRPPEALREKIQRGELGVKTGKGFYTYPDPEFLRPGFLDPFPEGSDGT